MAGRVHLYVQDFPPIRNGSGTNNRIYSNVRAYVDLGYDVEVVYVQTRNDAAFVQEPTLPVRWAHLPALAATSAKFSAKRVAYWLGWPKSSALDFRFATRAMLRSEVRKRAAIDPSAIHQFEYLNMACVIPDTPSLRCVWSVHDIESRFLYGHHQMREKLEGRPMRASDRRAFGYVEMTERLAAAQSRLVLCIARHECDILRTHWACGHAEFFPMSLPLEQMPKRTRPLMAGNKLRLLHLGRIDSLPSFHSLQFLLGSVFPLLRACERERVELVVVGEVRNSKRSQTILDAASRFPNVMIAGFQEDIMRYYSEADLQVVGCTEATGLRTRIVESWAYGVPVLSTVIGAEGVEGIVNGRNILLSETPEAFAEKLRMVLDRTVQLESIAAQARDTYDHIYSRGAVARSLANALSKHGLSDLAEPA